MYSMFRLGFCLIKKTVVASCTATEGGVWVDSESTDPRCFFKEGNN